MSCLQNDGNVGYPIDDLPLDTFELPWLDFDPTNEMLSFISNDCGHKFPEEPSSKDGSSVNLLNSPEPAEELFGPPQIPCFSRQPEPPKPTKPSNVFPQLFQQQRAEMPLIIQMNGTPIFGPDAYQHPAVETPAKKRSHAHHIAEKDYRKRLQQALSKLRSVCCAGSDATICGVYKKATECIETLRQTNCHLVRENASLKLLLMGNHGKSDTDTDSVSSTEVLPELFASELFSANSPSSSCADVLDDLIFPESVIGMNSPNSSCADVPEDLLFPDSVIGMNSPNSSCADGLLYPGKSPMFDRTRFAMCLLMLSFCIFDPFDLLFAWHSGFTSSSKENIHSGGRLLMAVNPSPLPSNRLSMSLVLCLLFRTIAIFFIFLKVFVFGEPSLQPDSKIAAKYWAFKQQADLTLEKGDYIESSKILGRCLEILGRPLPTSRVDMLCSLLWHIFRQTVHRVLGTRWLTAKAIQWFSLRATYEKDIEYRKESAKQAALVYHQLHHIYLAGHVYGSKWLTMLVALNAVNMADMADISLNEEIRVDIYIDCAIQLRSTLPWNLKFLARYFLSRARKLCRGQSLTLPYSCWWLFTPVGHRFFVSGEWNCKREANIWSSSKTSDNKPLASVTQAFCEFLLEQVMSALLLSNDSNQNTTNTWSPDRPDDNSDIKRAFDLLHTMTECVNNSRKSGINRNLKVFGDFTTWPSDEPDLVGCWWAALAKVAAYWLLGDVQAAQEQYKIIENIPDEIDNDSDPIGQALLMAFRARSRLLEKSGENPDDAHQIIDYCDKGGALLNKSLAFSALQPQSHLLKLMHLLCCDWLLSTRADLWHNEKLDGEHSLDTGRLNGFNKDLRSLQEVASYISDAMPKVYKYQAEFGVMADSNPLKTQRLLQKSLVQQRSTNEENSTNTSPKSSVSAERDRANALVLASSHLPASLHSSDAKRKDMIFEAMESLQKFGDNDRLARCRKLVTMTSDI